MIVRKHEHFTLPPTLETSVLLYLQGAVIMNPNCVRKPEQIKLIMKCRQSGLSDYQWCRKRGIHPGTFYKWSAIPFRIRKVTPPLYLLPRKLSNLI